MVGGRSSIEVWEEVLGFAGRDNGCGSNDLKMCDSFDFGGCCGQSLWRINLRRWYLTKRGELTATVMIVVACVAPAQEHADE